MTRAEPATGAARDDDESTPVDNAVADVVSPAAPGHDELTAPVDLAQVVPRSSTPRRRASWVAVSAGAAFVVLAVGVTRGYAPLLDLDVAVHQWAVDHRGAVDVDLALAVTWFGATTVGLPALAVVGAVAPRGPKPWRSRLGSGALLAGLASVGVYAGLAINGWTGRQRPPVVDWAGVAGGPAFPSGHTTMATLLAGGCAWALTARWTGRRARIGIWAGAAVVAGAVGWSRVWLGVHWPTDVLGGWLFASAWTAAWIGVLTWLRRRQAHARAQD